MRKLLMVFAACLVAGPLSAATVVLKGGKQLQVDSFHQDGNLLVVQYEGGRLVSYPLVAVDLDAMGLSTQPAVVAPDLEPEVPHSPFFGAQAPPGKSAVVMTDEDVMHVPDEEGEWGAQEQQGTPAAGQVVISGYQKHLLEDGTWEINASVLNQGAVQVSNIVATMNLMDSAGQLLGTGSGTFEGSLDPGQQGVELTSRAQRDFFDGPVDGQTLPVRSVRGHGIV